VFFGGIVAFSAPFIIPLLFGEQYGPAVAVMQILALAVPIRFVQHGYGAMLFSREHIRKKVLYMGIAAVLSAVWMVLLTPQFGVRGAAGAAVLSELVLLLLYMLAAARHVEGVNVRATFHWATLVAAHKYATGHGKDA
jgi:O-antigen/teichoic acid export membrane protein